MGQSLMAAFTSGTGLSIILGSCGTPVLAALALLASPLRGNTALFLYRLGNGLALALVGTLARTLPSVGCWGADRKSWNGFWERV